MMWVCTCAVCMCVCVGMCRVWTCAVCAVYVCVMGQGDRIYKHSCNQNICVHLQGQTYSSILCVCVVYESIVWMYVCCASVYACLWHSGILLKQTSAKVCHFRSARTSFKDGMSPSHVYTKVKVCYQSTTSQKTWQLNLQLVVTLCACARVRLSICLSVSTKNTRSPDPGRSICAKYFQAKHWKTALPVHPCVCWERIAVQRPQLQAMMKYSCPNCCM